MPVLGTATMQSGPEIASFSPGGEYLAVCSPDGRLALWAGGEAGPARLDQQLVPSDHLEAAATCLTWAPPPNRGSLGRKKKKKAAEGGEEGPDLIAVGTRAGSVLLYSTRQGGLVTVLKQQAASSVNSVAWSHCGSSLYTAGQEGKVTIFSISKQAELSSFQAGSDPIFSLALSPDDTTLVAGSRDIKIWDIASRSLVKSLTGHSNPVSCLRVAGGRVFSVAEDERVVAVWRLEGEERGQCGGLAVNEAVGQFHLTQEEEQVTVAVVTISGNLQIFTPKLEGKKHRKPLKAGRLLSIAAEKDSSGKVAPIPVLAARLSNKGEVIIGHGGATKPSIERLQLQQIESSHCLVRAGPQAKVEQQEQFTKTVTPKTDGGVVFLAPGVTLPVGTGKLGKRKVSRPLEGEAALPMEERLALLSTGRDSSKTPPRTDTLAQLLAQGLHSNDSRILSSVLDRADPQLIDNTVKRIPVEAVVPLVTTLMRYIKGRGRVDASHAKWLRSVLALHTGYLVSVPECRDLLTPVFALLEARTHNYAQVLQLRGKLELLTKQTEGAAGEGGDVDTAREALLVYQDDSSDELEDVMDDLLVPASDTDDDWDDEEGDETMEASKLGSDSDDCVEIVNGGGQDEEMESEDD